MLLVVVVGGDGDVDFVVWLLWMGVLLVWKLFLVWLLLFFLLVLILILVELVLFLFGESVVLAS